MKISIIFHILYVKEKVLTAKYYFYIILNNYPILFLHSFYKLSSFVVNVKTSFRWRYRDCYFDVESPQLPDGCHDMKDYNRFVNNSFLSLLSKADGTPTKEIDGFICVCDDNKCNLKLPDREPGTGTGSLISAHIVHILVPMILWFT